MGLKEVPGFSNFLTELKNESRRALELKKLLPIENTENFLSSVMICSEIRNDIEKTKVAILDEKDREILTLYKDELRDLEENAERLESNLFDMVGSFEPPGIGQRVMVSIFPKKWSRGGHKRRSSCGI